MIGAGSGATDPLGEAVGRGVAVAVGNGAGVATGMMVGMGVGRGVGVGARVGCPLGAGGGAAPRYFVVTRTDVSETELPYRVMFPLVKTWPSVGESTVRSSWTGDAEGVLTVISRVAVFEWWVVSRSTEKMSNWLMPS